MWGLHDVTVRPDEYWRCHKDGAQSGDNNAMGAVRLWWVAAHGACSASHSAGDNPPATTARGLVVVPVNGRVDPAPAVDARVPANGVAVEWNVTRDCGGGGCEGLSSTAEDTGSAVNCGSGSRGTCDAGLGCWGDACSGGVDDADKSQMVRPKRAEERRRSDAGLGSKTPRADATIATGDVHSGCRGDLSGLMGTDDGNGDGQTGDDGSGSSFLGGGVDAADDSADNLFNNCCTWSAADKESPSSTACTPPGDAPAPGEPRMRSSSSRDTAWCALEFAFSNDLNDVKSPTLFRRRRSGVFVEDVVARHVGALTRRS